jgi:RHS repeat-associated protein
MMKNILKRLTLWSLCLLIAPAWAAERTTYYHLDLLGSPAAATDRTGQVQWREEYKPYGERILKQAASTENALWYTGKAHDESMGLSYFGARWHDPELGRFTGIDPVGVQEDNIHSFNRYAYANNNPYRYVDPDGQVAETAIDIISLGLSIAQFKQDPSIVNGLGVAFDGLATAVPFLPGGFGIVKSAGNIADGIGDTRKGLPDNAIVCRGGTCTADRFANASGAAIDSQGKLSGVSVNSAPGKSVQELSQGIPNNKVGVTTVGDVRNAGGNVVPSPSASNPNHCTLCGITPQKAEKLFTPTIKNPSL